MAFGSVSKKLKTNRISSSSIINENKKNHLVNHFSFVKNFKNTISKHILTAHRLNIDFTDHFELREETDKLALLQRDFIKN